MNIKELINILWFENTLFGQLIIVSIGALLILSVYFAVHHIKRYRGFETNHLNNVISRLRRWRQAQHDVAESAAESKDTQGGKLTTFQPILDTSELKAGIPLSSIIGDRLEAIAKMRASHVKVNVHALQQMSLAKETPQLGLGLPGFIAGFSMLVGLLGTVVGLTFMVQKIYMLLPPAGSTISYDSLESYNNGLRQVLSEMKPAFSATLAGLFCSICAAGLNFFLGREQSQYFEKLERFTIEELLPATVPAVEDENLLEQISSQLETSFSRLDQITGQNVQTLKDLSAIENAFLQIISNVKEMAKGEASGNVQSVIGELTGVIGELSKVNRSITGVSENLPKVLELLQKNNQDMLKRFDKLIQLNMDQRMPTGHDVAAGLGNPFRMQGTSQERSPGATPRVSLDSLRSGALEQAALINKPVLGAAAAIILLLLIYILFR